MAFTPPDIEKILPALLRPYLPEGTYVGRKVPESRRNRMVTVRRQGGLSGRFIDEPRVGINVWAPTAEEANDMVASVAAALHDLAGKGDNPLKSASVYGWVEVPEASDLSQRYITADLSVRTV